MDTRQAQNRSMSSDAVKPGTKPNAGEVSLKHALGADLQERERDLRDFIENAAVALNWVAEDGTILWANRAELELLGYSRDEYIGHSIIDFHVDQAAILDVLGRSKNNEQVNEFEARLRCKD